MTHPKAAVDISRSMVEHLCHIHRGYKQHGTVAMLMALRADLDLEQMQGEEAQECINALKDSRDAMQAALDRAEADKAAAVEAERAARTDKMRLALAAAVAGERERCAMIAKTFDTVLVDTSGGTWKIQPTFDAVAAAIREAPQ